MHCKKFAASVPFKILAHTKLYTSINASLIFIRSYMTWETCPLFKFKIVQPIMKIYLKWQE